MEGIQQLLPQGSSCVVDVWCLWSVPQEKPPRNRFTVGLHRELNLFPHSLLWSWHCVPYMFVSDKLPFSIAEGWRSSQRTNGPAEPKPWPLVCKQLLSQPWLMVISMFSREKRFVPDPGVGSLESVQLKSFTERTEYLCFHSPRWQSSAFHAALIHMATWLHHGAPGLWSTQALVW